MHDDIASYLVPQLDEDFGHWLAGFIAGEGCFDIHVVRPAERPDRFGCRVVIALREDDRDVLEEIATRTGCGYVHVDRAKPSRPHHGPAVAWRASSKADCAKLISILDRFPLRAKKRHEYAIWRKAVLRWLPIRQGVGIDLDPTILELREQLQAEKRYRRTGQLAA